MWFNPYLLVLFLSFTFLASASPVNVIQTKPDSGTESHFELSDRDNRPQSYLPTIEKRASNPLNMLTDIARKATDYVVGLNRVSAANGALKYHANQAKAAQAKAREAGGDSKEVQQQMDKVQFHTDQAKGIIRGVGDDLRNAGAPKKKGPGGDSDGTPRISTELGKTLLGKLKVPGVFSSTATDVLPEFRQGPTVY